MENEDGDLASSAAMTAPPSPPAPLFLSSCSSLVRRCSSWLECWKEWDFGPPPPMPMRRNRLWLLYCRSCGPSGGRLEAGTG